MPATKFPMLKEFAAFISEREKVHQLRLAGKPAPWTKDPILQAFRFTNVRREEDRVTKWIFDNWLAPHERDYDTVVFAMCVARLINLPVALEAVGYPAKEGWLKRFKDVMAKRSAQGLPVFTSAYMINAVGAVKGELKSDYLARRVLPPLWTDRKRLGDVLKSMTNVKRSHSATLRELHNKLMEYHGFGGGFMAAQVIADVKHTPAGRKASDWYTFAASGPGSRRGLAYLVGEPGKRWKEEEWYEVILALQERLRSVNLPPTIRDLDLQNIQNANCEFSKYYAVKYLGGCVKRTFKPSEEPYV